MLEWEGWWKELGRGTASDLGAARLCAPYLSTQLTGRDSCMGARWGRGHGFTLRDKSSRCLENKLDVGHYPKCLTRIH